jgi:hypothetical protein
LQAQQYQQSPSSGWDTEQAWGYIRVIQDKIVKSVKRGPISAPIPTPIREESICILVTCLPLFPKATLNQCLHRGFEQLKIVHPLKREEHQNRYIWKITPNLDAMSKIL